MLTHEDAVAAAHSQYALSLVLRTRSTLVLSTCDALSAPGADALERARYVTNVRRGTLQLSTSNAQLPALQVTTGSARSWDCAKVQPFQQGVHLFLAAVAQGMPALEALLLVGFRRGRGGGDCGFIIHRPATSSARSWRRLRRGDGRPLDILVCSAAP